MPEEEGARTKRSRLRKAAEQLYEDSRLRDSLTDDEAQKLLSWAYKQLEQTVDSIEAMPEEEAMPIVEGQRETVKKVVQRVNAIMGAFSREGEGKSHRSLASLVEVLDQEGKPPTLDEASLEMELMAERESELDRDGLFRRLMDAITAEEEAE